MTRKVRDMSNILKIPLDYRVKFADNNEIDTMIF